VVQGSTVHEPKDGIQFAQIPHILDSRYRIKSGTGSAGMTLLPLILAKKSVPFQLIVLKQTVGINLPPRTATTPSKSGA